MDRSSPAMRPPGRPVGFQRWRSLLFLHWEIAPDLLRPLVPPALSLDTFEGRAYLGVIPLTMRDVSPSWFLSVPGISNFHELNVRTYVHYRGREPGIYFFSLDAAKLVAVLVARLGLHLPYQFARMTVDSRGGEVRYRSERRRWPADGPAAFEARYRVGERLGPAAPGTFEHFLTERYLLYVDRGKRLMLGRVHHHPYELCRAEVVSLRETVVRAAGLPAPTAPPHVLYSPGVDVDLYKLTTAAR